MEDKLVIIDGNSIIYREFFALPITMRNSKGEPTNAIYGFTNILLKVIKELKPTHLVVGFDVSKHTFRNDLYDGYKATRKPMPPELKTQLQPIKHMLELMNIKYIQKEGLEGDDIIGSLCKKFSCPTVIITGDRDSFQLIDKTTTVYLNKKGMSDVKIMDEQAMQELYGVTPDEFVFVKSLAGDTSDNIPGVKGVGEKTALELVKKYSNLDNIYANIDEIKGSLKQKLVDCKEDAYLSYKLAKINTEVEVGVELQDIKLILPFTTEVLSFFKENAFKSLASKTEFFNLDGEQDNNVENVGLTKQNIEINSLKELSGVVAVLNGKSEFGYYYSGTSVELSDGTENYSVKLSENLLDGETPTIEEVLHTLKPLFENAGICKVLFNSKAERHFLRKFNIEILGEVFDCMLARHLESGESITSFTTLTDDFERLQKLPALSLTEAKVVLLNALDRNEMNKLYFDVELPLAQVLYNMECRGFKIDINKLKELDAKYSAEISQLTKQIYDVVGFEFNVNSPKQLAEIIYDKLQLSKSKKRSTAMEVLEELEGKHPLIALVLRYRKISKYQSGFIKNMYEKLDENNFIHTTFNQSLTTTGRLSSTEPNLQNIPVRGDESRALRSMFVAGDEKRVLIDADYSQIELRILAHLTEDELLLKAFKNNEDIHTQTACAVFGITEDLVTPEMRRLAKVVNFGVNYGISDFGLARDLKIPVPQAREYITAYYTAHPKIKEYNQTAINNARETGRVKTILGRTRKMLDINSSNFMVRQGAERASQNMPVQGSASDIIKLAMLKLEGELTRRNLDAKLIMQVHDELIIDCNKDVAEEVQKIVKECMQSAYNLCVPLDVDSTISYRWSEGH